MAEGRYTRIKSRFWVDEKVRAWDNDTRFLALYLLTSPHNNILGCYVLPKLYICEDIGWLPEQLTKPFNQLIEDDFIKYDESNRVMLLSNYLKHNPIENGNQATAAIKQLNELPTSPLFQDLKALLEQLNKPFLEPLLKQIGDPVTVTVTVTVTENRNCNNICSPGGESDCNDAPAENPEQGGAQERDCAKTAPGEKPAPTVGKAPGKGEEYTVDFEHFWALYPKHVEKKRAFKNWKTRLKDGDRAEEMIRAAENYAKHCGNRKTESQYIKHASTFLGPDKPFLDFVYGVPVEENRQNARAEPKGFQGIRDWMEINDMGGATIFEQ